MASKDSHIASNFAKTYSHVVENGTWGPQPELKNTLEKLSLATDEALYNGSIGESIISALRSYDVIWDMQQDFHIYRVQEPDPIEVSALF